MPIASSPAHPPHCLIRRVTCVRGRVEFETAAEPRFGYGRQQHALLAHPRGVIFQAAPGLSLALASPRPLTLTQAGAHARFALAHSDSATFALVPADRDPPGTIAMLGQSRGARHRVQAAGAPPHRVSVGCCSSAAQR